MKNTIHYIFFMRLFQLTSNTKYNKVLPMKSNAEIPKLMFRFPVTAKEIKNVTITEKKR